MSSIVVDASVVAAAAFHEEHAEAAAALLASTAELLAPDLIYVEFANVAWKYRRRGEISEQEAAGLVKDLLAMPLRIMPAADLINESLRLAMSANRSVYDSVYMALAIQEKAIMVTADRRLVNALTNTHLQAFVRFVDAPA